MQQLHDRLPNLDSEVVNHLARDDESEFIAYSGRISYRKLMGVRNILTDSYVGATSAADLQGRRDFVKPYLAKVDRALEVEFGSPEYRAETKCRSAMTAEQNFRLQQLMAMVQAERAVTDTAISRQLARLRELRAEFDAIGYPRGVMMVELDMSDVVMRVGRMEERQRLLRSAVARARALNERSMLCQALGGLGLFHIDERLSQNDRSLEEMYEIATRHRMDWHRARALQFMGANAELRGQYARALDLMRESMLASRESGGGTEYRFVVRTMVFLGGLGCWDVVDRLAARLPPLERDMTVIERRDLRSMIVTGATLGARATMKLGRVEEGAATFRAIESNAESIPGRIHYAQFLDVWSAALLDASLPAEALPIVERGIRWCQAVRVDETLPALMLRRARILSQLGRHEDAIAAVRDLEGRVGNLEIDVNDEVLIAARALSAHVMLEQGERTGAARRARQSLDMVASYARKLDGGPTSELALAMLQEVRGVAHRALAPGPADGYWLEMDWRSMTNRLGASPPWMTSAAGKRETTLGPGEMHVVFHVEPGAIMRWTATSKGIRRDRIPLGRDSCSILVRQAASHVRGPGTGHAERPGRRGRGALSQLANQLLPPELESAGPGRIERVWISSDGPLNALPFDALPVGDGRVLARVCDVAYLHSPVSAAPSARKQAPVIVGSPEIPAEVRRRHAGLDALPAVEQEVTAARRVWPEALVIEGRAATRDTVLAAWGRASHIYLAAHLVQDPEVPIATFIPVAALGGGSEASAYLDPRHVRAVDLSGCQLVVLSACSGGAPYVGSHGATLGMAGAFLDAGAAAVVRTAWPIRDDDAQRFAVAFLNEWARNRQDAVGALNRARRQLLSEAPDGPWFAWSIAVNGLPATEFDRALAKSVAP